MRLRLALVTVLLVAPSLSAAVVEAEHGVEADRVVEAGPVAAAAPAAWSDAWLLAHTEAYLTDADARRTAMAAALTNPDNLYARARLAAYGLDHAGWDVLPTWNPRAAVLDDAMLAGIASGDVPTLDGGVERLWDGARPQTMAQWVALGRRVFFTYPLRPEQAAGHAIASGPAAVGLHRDRAAGDGGVLPGMVVFRDIDGADKLGITCALCHSTVEDGALVAGRARRDFDYGAMRLAWHDAVDEPMDPQLASRMAGWGPGRADITEDDDADPVAIPDLWRLRDLRYLTQAATIVHDRRDGAATPLTLAIRQETQYIHANGERTRPPRELAWALTMFLYSIDAPRRAGDPTVSTATLERGRALFDEHCVDCHGDASHSGEAVAVRRVGTDPALANGLARGTGLYRPAPLVALAQAGPYLHDGTIATLADLLDPARMTDDFDRGVHARGPVRGHAYGTALSPNDRDALVAWLRTL